MKASFLVTYYNQEQYVKQSLDSILRMKKPCDWEVIIGDDGSSDRTVDLIQEYVGKDPVHFQYFVMPREKDRKYLPVLRASRIRMEALERSTGDFFCTLDGDDFYTDTGFLEDALRILERMPEIAVVSFGFQCFRNEELSETNVIAGCAGGVVDWHDYLRNHYLHAGACVYRTHRTPESMERIRRAGFYDDNDIMINSLRMGEMYHIPRAVYAYRQTGESVYTSMNLVEQALLNVLGYDVDVQLIGEEYRDDLIFRNSSCLLTLYTWRRRISEILPEEKLRLYREACETIPDSLVCQMISDSGEKIGQQGMKTIRRARRLNPVRYGKVLLKYMYEGRKK